MRLFFGVSSAPELFHNKIRSLLEGLEGVQNACDDILIMSQTQAEDFERTEQVLKALKNNGLTVNPDKCEFTKKEITFFGLKLSESGVALNEIKMKALKEFKTPENASVLHSFLGLSTYASRWIKNLAKYTKPLWKLTKKDTKFEWLEHHQVAFDLIKNTLIEKVGYFKLDWDTQVHCDASVKGLGAWLTQSNPKNPEKNALIYCISRALTPSEQNYSQIELEALVLPWTFERLDLYLIGRKFVVYTDNRAVALIYNNPLSNPPAVIRRWRLRIDSFDFKVVHRAGLGNIADFLSRHPLKERISGKYQDDSVAYINSIVDYCVPLSISRNTVLEETLKDSSLMKLSRMIKRSKFIKGHGANEFCQVFKELSVSEEGFVLKGHKLVIPKDLIKRVLDLAHEGHLGMVKTKQLIRSKVWFPKIDSLVEEKIRKCLACQACEKTSHKIIPLMMSEMPEAPWENLSVDFYGPIAPTNEYLIVIQDDYSRFPVVINTFSLKSEVIEPKLEAVFGTFGIPKILRSDNGPPFQSSSFGNFCRSQGIIHRLNTPLWPRSNGIAEAFMKPLGKVIQTAKIEGIPWKKRLVEYLRSYRSTPHMSTGVAPSLLLFRNANLSKLPSYKGDFVKTKLNEVARRIDGKRKQVMKNNADKNLHTGGIKLVIGDMVLVKQVRFNKSMSYFDPLCYKIKDIKGNMVTAIREGKIITRNISFFKKWEGKTKDGIKPILKGVLKVTEKDKERVKMQEVLFTPYIPPIQENINPNEDLVGDLFNTENNLDSPNTSNANVENDSSEAIIEPVVNVATYLGLNEETQILENNSSDHNLDTESEILEEEIAPSMENITTRKSARNADKPVVHYDETKRHQKKP